MPLTLFLSTSPLRGTTSILVAVGTAKYRISIHVPLAGDDAGTGDPSPDNIHFYPRPPCGGRHALVLVSLREINISIHVPLAGDDQNGQAVFAGDGISIHVPLAGDDFHRALRHFSSLPFLSTSPLRGTTKSAAGPGPAARHFYPRPPCGGRRQPQAARARADEFLSTSPLRGTTVVIDAFGKPRHISIHVPLAGDDAVYHAQPVLGRQISIHVPLAGDDLPARGCAQFQNAFLSTSPLRGTTLRNRQGGVLRDDFYPRPPCGGRRVSPSNSGWVSSFLSTSPLRGTTACRHTVLRREAYFYPRPPCGGRPLSLGILTAHSMRFLSTSPLRGTTGKDYCLWRVRDLFLSTSPLRGTTAYPDTTGQFVGISIHVPLAGDDVPTTSKTSFANEISIHVPLAGDDTSRLTVLFLTTDFYPRPPCGGRPGR